MSGYRSRRSPLPHVGRVTGGRRAPAGLVLLRIALSIAPLRAHETLQRVAARLLRPTTTDLVFHYSDGRAFVLPASDRAYVSVLTLGAYEPQETHVVKQLLSPGEFAIDVGANYGWFSTAMATAVGPSGCVWAVEPTPAALRVLNENLVLNPHLSIRVIPIALGKSASRVSIHVFRGLPTGHSSVSTLGRDDFDVYECETRTLDSLLQDAGKSPVLVKLDVEGSELAILEGSDELLRSRMAPIWLIEVNYETTRALGHRPVDLLGQLRSHADYHVFRVEASGLVAERSPESAPHGSSWLCVPSSRMDHLPPSLMS
jgi:FkbM family methyltransferase